jgi:phospholipase/lecithinase/hemolysin
MSTHLGKAMALALALSSMPAVILADPFTSVVVYGDSLSDNGNLFAATGGTIPGPPNFDGRRSNGPVAVEQLAAGLGVPLIDFAWDGATTGIGNFADGGTPTSFGAFGLPGMQTELASTAGLLGPFLSSGLFVVWGGPDDFLAPSPLDSFPSGVIARGVSDLVGIVATLQGLGAQHILVPGIPDLGLTPFFESMGPAFAAEGSAITDAFNAALVSSLPKGAVYFNAAALLRQMVADPSSFGFTDVTDPCFNGTTVCANPDQFLFWDDFHPTTATDSFVAKAFETAVPEPATIVLLPAALMLCFVIRKQRPYQR